MLRSRNVVDAARRPRRSRTTTAAATIGNKAQCYTFSLLGGDFQLASNSIYEFTLLGSQRDDKFEWLGFNPGVTPLAADFVTYDA